MAFAAPSFNSRPAATKSRTPTAASSRSRATAPRKSCLTEVFEVTDRAWRGIGVIPKSGWRLSEAYRDFDAEQRFHITGIHTQESALCRAGDVLRGAIKPAECAAFGKECTPRHPLGATMVSSEGACAAYYNYGRFISAEELASAGAGLTGAAHA